MSARISLRGLRRLIWVDALRRGHNVGFLAGQLKTLQSVNVVDYRIDETPKIDEQMSVCPNTHMELALLLL